TVQIIDSKVRLPLSSFGLWARDSRKQVALVGGCGYDLAAHAKPSRGSLYINRSPMTPICRMASVSRLDPISG
ncbi:MAG: hypothetical protein OXP73_04495, partial [Chloroflexota bacterium]|nr:hypothetical protein [Chloroflexota bacterium]